jgi:Fe2+ transport system protein FeoA
MLLNGDGRPLSFHLNLKAGEIVKSTMNSNSGSKKPTLTNVSIGSTAKVVAVNGTSRISRRLMEMGVIPGVSLEVLKAAPFGDPIEVRVRGYNLAMRRSEADAIEIAD